MREELYVLPGILLNNSFFFQKQNKFKKLFKMFFKHYPINFGDFTYISEKNFVPEAEHFGISN